MTCVLTKREIQSIHRLAQQMEKQGMVAESTTLRNILRVGSERGEVRASVAAQILHVTPQTVRNWVRRGLLHGRIDDTGHIYVATEELRSAIEMDAAMPYRPASAPDISTEDILAEIAAERAEQHA
ncbi:MAG: hypothetical protein HY675_15530 [Chloroflexi bacterium]|nr:hypothetical protein [Chloroflexota bacterium]